MKKYLIVFLFSSLALWVSAQTAIGEFHAHISMNKFLSVACDNETVYAATDNGLMLLDKSSLDEQNPQLSSWTKVDGLSDIDIVKIHGDRRNNAS